MRRLRNLVCVAVWLAVSALAAASPFRGVVTFGGLPLPGATVTAAQGTKTETAVSDANGGFEFDDLADGKWTIDIQMQCFAPVHAEVTVAPNLPAATYELTLLDSAQIQSSAQPVKPTAETPPAPAAETGQPQPTKAKEKTQNNAQINPQEIPKAPEENEESADGFLVQGSVNNAATSPWVATGLPPPQPASRRLTVSPWGCRRHLFTGPLVEAR